MIVRLRLYHPVEGEFFASEPDGYIKSIAGFERHPTLHCLVLFYRTTFTAYGTNGIDDGGRNYFLRVEKNHGVNAVITADLQKAEDNIVFKTISSSEISIKSFIQSVGFDHVLQFNFKQKSTWTDFIERYDLPVDLKSSEDLNGNAVVPTPHKTISLSPQKLRQDIQNIQKKGFVVGTLYPQEFTQPAFIEEVSTDGKVQVNLDDVVKNELQTNHDNPLLIRNSEPVQAFWTAKYSGLTKTDIRVGISILNANTQFRNFTHWLDCNNNPNTPKELISMWIQFNKELPIKMTRNDYSYTFMAAAFPLASFSQTNRWSIFTFNDERPLNKGDQVRIWFENEDTRFGYGNNSITISTYQPYILGGVDNNVDIQPSYKFNGYRNGDILYKGTADQFYIPFVSDPALPIDPHIIISQLTEYPSTEAAGFTIHDAYRGIVERYGCKFFSPFLGSQYTSINYGAAGCGNNYMLFKGLHLRGFSLSEKPFFHSFKDLDEGFGPVMPIGIMEELQDGEPAIVAKPLQEMYPDTEPIINLYNVQKIKRVYKEDFFYNGARVGYVTGTNETDGGLNDPHCETTRVNILKTIGKLFEKLSNYIAASLLFEQARRAGEDKKKDYNLDDQTFLLSVDNTGGVYKPETTQNFTFVDGLEDGINRYNKRITPGRNFYRWIKWLNGSLFQYLGSRWNFSGGKGNYRMVSTMTSTCPMEYAGGPLPEDDYFTSAKGYFVPNQYDIEHYLTEEQWETLQANRHIPIGISQTDKDAKPFYIFDLQYSEFDKTLKIQACPKDFFELNGDLGNIPLADDQGIFDDTFGYPFE